MMTLPVKSSDSVTRIIWNCENVREFRQELTNDITVYSDMCDQLSENSNIEATDLIVDNFSSK